MSIRASRSLLLPGEQPPLTHLGVTLLRHAVGASLRYSLYVLGWKPTETPPVRIHRLRLLLDDAGLRRQLGDQPGADELRRALLDPGGAAESPLPARQRAAVALHRTRLRIHRHPWLFRPPRVGKDPAPSWAVFRRALSSWIPILGDALLADLTAVLGRRQARRRGGGDGDGDGGGDSDGGTAAPVMSREAARFLTGRSARLSFLGPPDVAKPSWAAQPPPAGLGAGSTTPPHPTRGRFREHYRRCLDTLRPAYLALAAKAAGRGLLDDPEDAFFLPLDLAGDLELASRPAWLDAAVAVNRREYETELGLPAPPDVLPHAEAQGTTPLGPAPDWVRGPIAPLP